MLFSVSEYHNFQWIVDQTRLVYQDFKICKRDEVLYVETVKKRTGIIFKFLHGIKQSITLLRREKSSPLSEIFYHKGEETQRIVMLDEGIFSIGSTMTSGKGVPKTLEISVIQKETMENIVLTLNDLAIHRKHASNSTKHITFLSAWEIIN